MKYFLHRGKRIYLSKIITNFEGSKAMVLDLNGKNYLIEEEQILEDENYKYYYIKCKELINGEWGKAYYYEKLETSTIDNIFKTISLVLKEAAMKFNTKKEAEESLKEIIIETKKNPYLYDENNNFIYKFEIVQE